MPSAPTRTPRMQCAAHAKQDTQILAHSPKWSALVSSATGTVVKTRKELFWCSSLVADTCQVQNGGCDVNAICSHDGITNAVTCRCKTGYTNTGSATNVSCTGRSIICITTSRTATSLGICTFIDTCLVSNGGCDPNAICSHETPSNAVTCTCKTGYSDTGNGSNVVCTGE